MGGGGINIYVQGLFCKKFNSKELSFEAFFDVMRIFSTIEVINLKNSVSASAVYANFIIISVLALRI